MSHTARARSPFDSYPGGNVDRIVAIVLLVVIAQILAAYAFFGLVTSFGAEGCGSVGSDCNETLFVIGWFASILIPVLGFLATLIYAVARMFRRLRAFWVPIAGLGFTTVAYAAALTMIFIEIG